MVAICYFKRRENCILSTSRKRVKSNILNGIISVWSSLLERPGSDVASSAYPCESNEVRDRDATPPSHKGQRGRLHSASSKTRDVGRPSLSEAV